MPNSCKNDIKNSPDDTWPGGIPIIAEWFKPGEAEQFKECYVIGEAKDRIDWQYLLDSLFAVYPIPNYETHPKYETGTWEEHVATTLNWYIDVWNKRTRKDVSHVGGYAADWSLTELLCRSGMWCKQYRVVHTTHYRIIFDERKDVIEAKGGRVNDDLIKWCNDVTLADIFECSACMMVYGRHADEFWKFME